MEPEYVTFAKVIANYNSKKVSPAEFQRQVLEASKFYTTVPIMNEQGDIIITEDIECEIVENKKLPASNGNGNL